LPLDCCFCRATLRNEKSTARWGPWTPRFKELFKKAGMELKDPENKGPHPERYHPWVFDELEAATRSCRSIGMPVMPKRFFRLNDDVHAPERWHLTHPTTPQGQEVDDPWQFTEGRPVTPPARLRIPVEIPGRALDFSLAGLSVPVIHAKVAPVFMELASEDVQLIPVDVEGQSEKYCILVAKRLIQCIDEESSQIQRWEPEDGLPEKVGQYFSVRDMCIDPARVGNAHVFRARDWPGPLIVSEDIKTALERTGATGMTFTEVSPRSTPHA